MHTNAIHSAAAGSCLDEVVHAVAADAVATGAHCHFAAAAGGGIVHHLRRNLRRTGEWLHACNRFESAACHASSLASCAPLTSQQTRQAGAGLP